MDSICAWCHAPLWSDVRSDETGPVSHGICHPCLLQAIRDLAEPFDEFLDGLGAPVLAVDGEGCVQASNALASALLGRSREDLVGLRGGDASGCIHALEPGGCGRQYHCRTCAIRRSVMHTHATGEPLSDVRAWSDTQHGEECQTLSLVISTSLVGGLVLLRVDSVSVVADAAAACAGPCEC